MCILLKLLTIWAISIRCGCKSGPANDLFTNAVCCNKYGTENIYIAYSIHYHSVLIIRIACSVLSVTELFSFLLPPLHYPDWSQQMHWSQHYSSHISLNYICFHLSLCYIFYFFPFSAQVTKLIICLLFLSSFISSRVPQLTFWGPMSAKMSSIMKNITAWKARRTLYFTTSRWSTRGFGLSDNCWHGHYRFR